MHCSTISWFSTNPAFPLPSARNNSIGIKKIFPVSRNRFLPIHFLIGAEMPKIFPRSIESEWLCTPCDTRFFDWCLAPKNTGWGSLSHA